MKSFPDESIDLVLTDPPYGISRESYFHTMKDRPQRTGMNFGNWDNSKDTQKALPEIERVLKPIGALLLFYDQLKLHEVSIMNPRRCIYWKKTNPLPLQQNPFPLSAVECILYSTKSKTGTYNGINQHNWFECHSPLPFQRLHPTQKPLELIKWLINLFSNENDVVLDPFVGSGTTCVASQKLGRKWIGIDINPEYCEMAKKRLMRECSQKLTKFLESE